MNNNTHERIFCHQSYSFSNLLLNQKKNIPKDSFRILTEFFFTIPKNCSWKRRQEREFTPSPDNVPQFLIIKTSSIA